ncbi:MAG: 6-carboxytetrahydropterin synthase [Candidatus Methanomethylicia archaeon]|nr:6-carboxytetrahydropterin synthase [Candidatus Methanomethylicia archaeon]
MSSGPPQKAQCSIFVEDSFDYSHFLPESEKCSPLHGHTSSVKLELYGGIGQSGMILDFAVAKEVLKSTLSTFDHKLIACRKYAVERKNEGLIEIHYGKYRFIVPSDHVFLIEGEGTSEELALVAAERLARSLPSNVESFRITFTEGLGKGSTISMGLKRA